MQDTTDEAYRNTLLDENVAPTDSTPHLKLIEAKYFKLKCCITTLCIVVGCLVTGLILSYFNYKHECFSSHEPSASSNKLKVLSNQTIQQIQTKSVRLVESNSKWNHSRLPVSLKPLSYEIALRIDVIEKKLQGNCTIRFECLQSTFLLVLHSEANILFQNASTKYFPRIVEIETDKSLEVKNIEVNAFYAYFIIELTETLQAGKTYSVYFESYMSEIRNNLKGIYYSTYATKSGQQKLRNSIKIFTQF